MRQLNLFLKSFLLLCCLIAGSSAWATVKNNISTVSTKFSATGDVTSKFTQTGAYTSATWNLSVTWKSEASWHNLDPTKGSQIGSAKKPATSIVLTGSNITGTISSVVVNTSGAKNIDATVGVSVGSTAFQCNSQATAKLTDSAADYNFTGSASGNIVITWTNSSSKAIYIKSITVTFDDGSSQTVTSVSFSQETYTATLGEDFTAPTPICNSNGTKTYTSSNTDVADVDESTGALTIKKGGNTTITLNVAENSSFTSGSASYILKVKGTIEDGIIDFSINQDYGSGAVPGTENTITTETTWTSGIVKLAVSGRNIWYNGESLRLYSNNAETGNNAGTITISIQTNDDLWITGLEVNGDNLDVLKNGGISISKWAGKTKSITFTHSAESGTAKIYKIKVHYTGPTISLTMNEDGYMTYFNKYANLSFGDLKAYIVTEIGENKVTLAEITKVPANTGVILKGTAGEHTLTIEESGDTYETNCLKKSSGFAATDTYNFWALAKKNDVVGFYKIPTGMTIPAGKCYLSVAKEASSARDFLGFNGEDATRVNAVENGQSTGVVFDLQGRQVENPTKGLYIKNGKKVIIK